MGDHRFVVGDDVVGRGRERRTSRQRSRAGHRVTFDVEIPRRVGPVLDRDHLERVDREELTQGAVQAGEHAGLVERRGHGSGDAVQRLEPPGLVPGQLVEGGVGEQDPEPAVDVLEELQLGGRHPPLLVRVIGDAADHVALVHDRDPDRELAPDARARPLADFLAGRLDREDGRFRVGELTGEGRLAHRPAPHVLQHAGVHRQRVVPTFALEDLEVDRVVAEPPLKAPVEDLDEVGFGHAAAELVDQRARGRARRLAGGPCPDDGFGPGQ